METNDESRFEGHTGRRDNALCYEPWELRGSFPSASRSKDRRQKLRNALDRAARRYPFFCVSLRRNEREFYYEINDQPVELLHANKAITLGSSETNGHIWAVCYDGEGLWHDCCAVHGKVQ